MNPNYVPPQPIYSAPPPQQQTSGFAVASLVLGILTWLGGAICGAGIAAVICGHIALSAIKHGGGRVGGRGVALAGLVLGYISVVVGGVILAFFLGLVGLGAKISSDEQARLMGEIAVDQQVANDRAVKDADDLKQRNAAIGGLEQFVGTYQDVSSTISIAIENDVLKTSTTYNDQTCVLQIIEKDRFVYKRCKTGVANAKMEFNRNQAGDIIGMTLQVPSKNVFCKKLY
ncbi:MAG: DUF4190 domain-containing protein [Pyrinomonadaceae bacterium MAG19_C2-C3]|nr:DUF4190 domain-containing protein [Pyrinomonadaceae bacterium MAG19_C2-C3]